jgi:signal transduction histidine kinase
LCAIADKFNNPDSTIKYAQQAKDISKRLHWVDGEFESGFRVGRSLHRQNLLYQAIEVYFELLTLTEKNHFKKRKAIVLRAMGDSNRQLPNFRLAHKYFRLSMQLFKELKEYEEFADTQNNLAIAYNNDSQPEKAIILLKNCLTYLPYIKGKWSEINFYENLSMSYNILGKYKTALEYSLKALKKIELLGDEHKEWKSDSMLMIGFLYYKMGQNSKALFFSKLAQNLLPNHGLNDSDMNDLYYRIYKDKNHYLKALKHLELYKKAEDVKTQLTLNREIESLKSSYDLEKERDKVLLLNTNLEKENLQKRIGIAGLIIITGFLIFAYWNFINQKRKSKQIGEQKIAIQELNNSLENKVLQRTQELSEANQELIRKNQEISEALFKGQSIERTRVASALHDNLGGSMAAVKWMLESIDTEKLSEDDRKVYQNALNITAETYSDVRFMSHNFIPEVLAQLGLQNAVKKLCHEISQTNRLQMSFEDKTFSEFTHQIELEIYSICLELITNILKHSKATEAKILMQEDESTLTITVVDNGIGMNEKDKNGKGLKNISKRLEAIKGKIETNNIANIHSCFILTIPLAMTVEYMNSQAENLANEP